MIVLPSEQIIFRFVRETSENIVFGLDLAHAVGNLELSLHEWGVDFACWCTYKYLNSGPGGIGGAFVHEKHLGKLSESGGLLGGWWGHRLSDRFDMKPQFKPEMSALGWQVSNPPIILLASLNASLDLFHKAQMKNLRRKSVSLTRYLEILIELILNKNCQDKPRVEIFTPRFDRFSERGAHLSLKFIGRNVEDMYKAVENEGVIADVRKPNVIRVAPCPMYNSFQDVYDLVSILKHAMEFDS